MFIKASPLSRFTVYNYTDAVCSLQECYAKRMQESKNENAQADIAVSADASGRAAMLFVSAVLAAQTL